MHGYSVPVGVTGYEKSFPFAHLRQRTNVLDFKSLRLTETEKK